MFLVQPLRNVAQTGPYMHDGAFATLADVIAFYNQGGQTYSSDAALFYVIYLFQQAFEFLNMGYASAMAWLLFAIIMAVTAVQHIVSRRLVYYEGEER